MQQQRSFQYSDPSLGVSTSRFAHIFNLKKANDAANLPSTDFNFRPAQPIYRDNQQYFPQFQLPPSNFQQQPFLNNPRYWQNFAASNHIPQRDMFYNSAINLRQSQQVAVNRSSKTKASLLEDFKRIYITEVLTFTMSKATLFTLIFSFMFLGCVFFLSGFFTATSIYREQHSLSNTRKHEPSENAMLQGRPEKIVNMGQGVNHVVPKNYRYQGGVQISQNGRRPSPYTDQQISSQQPYYR